MHAWLTGWWKDMAQTQAELELLKYAYHSGRAWRKHRLNWNLLSLFKNVRAFTQKRFRSAQPRMLKGHIWLTALQSQTACSLRGLAIATYSLTRRVRRSALAYLPAGERERHCYRMGGMAALLLLI
jgi:hypothetical protein